MHNSLPLAVAILAPTFAASLQPSKRQFTHSEFPSGCESACATYDASFAACGQLGDDLSGYVGCICEPTPQASISACLGCAGNSTDERKDQFAQDLVDYLKACVNSSVAAPFLSEWWLPTSVAASGSAGAGATGTSAAVWLGDAAATRRPAQVGLGSVGFMILVA